jgi:flagellar biosynthesis anti-sigma factor FlgM
MISRDDSSKTSKKDKTSESTASTGSGASDAVELSSAGRVFSKINDVPDVRQERVAQIKEQIANGTYMTDEKLKNGIRSMIESV